MKIFSESVIIYFTFLMKEFISPMNYIMALLIGVVINSFQLGIDKVFSSVVPFIVPIIVQAFSKSSVKFSNRKVNLLVKLPMERIDPAFVMERNGNIMASEGNTKKYFKKNKINNFYQLFPDEKRERITKIMKTCEINKKHHTEELYSDMVKKWYSINFKYDNTCHAQLVWMHDITMRKSLDNKLHTVRNFSVEMMTSIEEQVREQDSYDRLASFVLDKGYEGVFIAYVNNEKDLEGNVYKMDEKKLKKSERLIIEKTSSAPIWESRKNKGMVHNSSLNFMNQSDFENAYPFDARVKDFLGFRIDNFINYHEEDISFIVFNKNSEITTYDLLLMEAIVNSAFSINYLIAIKQD